MASYLKSISKDHLSAVMLIGLGATVLAVGLGYRMGSLNRMGAGFIPAVLGALLIAVGVAIGVTAAGPGRTTINPLPGDGHHSGAPEWRGWGCILGGVLAFVLGHWGGLGPATFASVFVSALGDRENSWRGSAILAAVATVFCNSRLPLRPEPAAEALPVGRLKARVARFHSIERP